MRNKYGKLVIGLSLVLIGLVAGNSGVVVQGFQTMANLGELIDATLIDGVQVKSPPKSPTSSGETYEPVQ